MFINNLKLSFRLLLRNPFFSIINILGLAVGFAVFFLLWQYGQRELKSDRQWRDWERMARVGFLWEWSDDDKNWESEKYGSTGPPFAVQLIGDFPELESFTRILYRPDFTKELTGLDGRLIIAYEKPDHSEVRNLEDKVVMADANLFEFFSIPLVKGEPTSALKEVNSVVVSSAIAIKYFGHEEPLGKIISVNKQPHTITGIFNDLPHNTHLDFQLVLSNRSKYDYWTTAFGPPRLTTYLKNKTNTDWTEFTSKVNQPEMIEKYYGPALRRFKAKATVLIQPLNHVAFSQKWRGDHFNPKSETLLHIFQSVGLAVLVLAFVNYISLTSSRIKHRQAEIATRKVSGAVSSDFIKQFMTESGIVVIMALALALTLLQLIKYPLYVLLQIPVFEIDQESILLMLAIVAFMMVLSAAYPIYLSRVRKIRALFSKSKHLGGSTLHQGFLAGIQLSIAVVLIIWGFMIYNQVTYVLSRDLGFNKEHLITIEAPVFKPATYEADVEVFKNRVRALSGIENMASSSTVMGDDVWGFGVKRLGSDNPFGFDTNGGIDEYFIPFYDIKILAGRNFNITDRGNRVIVSEGALTRLGIGSPEEAVGSKIQVEGGNEYNEIWNTAEIIGVVKSYRLRPMLKFSGDHDLRADAGIILTYKNYLNPNLLAEKFTVRVEPDKIESSMRAAEQAYNEIFPGNVFRWYFLDDYVNRHYTSEKIWRNQILLFTCLAIGIACLGMLGMISNKASEKTKEIGIRKVLGADLYQVAQLLLNTTAKQIAVAAVIGIPVAHYLTQQYLQKFSERIELQWWHFALPLIILTAIMLATIASVVWKAARSNPVEALKYE
jgi:putative ABC transport system permease protein